jgi:hypothetical protein
MRRLAVALLAAVVLRNTYTSGGRRQGWIRVFGWGIHWKNATTETMRFAERNGYRRPSVVVGDYWITVLRRGRLRGS